ncbi:MAG: ATP-dependent DNA helicase [Propionibacteriaceae bacterium]|nr:ATP-dependent DNA helicase [Propionibacteriaceae bacterium]
MVRAIDATIAEQGRLLVQAGTGTGKSLGYLAPAAAYLADHPTSRVVVATATLALQTQLATKDIPLIVAATAQVAGRELAWTLLKGRANYACLLRVRDQAGAEAQDDLLTGGTGQSSLGAEVVALRQWAEEEWADQGTGDRDAAPAHSPKAWAQVAVSGAECLGPKKCPYFADCFAEHARERARASDLVVTNHSLVAVDAELDGAALPDHDLVVFDEAHELPARVTGAATGELSPQMVERVTRRAAPYLTEEAEEALRQAGTHLKATLDVAGPGRVTDRESAVAAACRELAAAARTALSLLAQDKSADAEKTQAAGVLEEIHGLAGRLAALGDGDVVWVSVREAFGAQLVVAPLSVAETIRDQLLGPRTAILTSATLALGGTFGPTALSLGLDPAQEGQDWRAVDVGSPFDYGKQAILYVARHLPAPGRDGLSEATLDEIADLVDAAGGRALGLFSSFRAAQEAAAWVRAKGARTVLCQGDGHLPDLVRRFTEDPATSLFGTLSLWQGVDAPGVTCQLVLIDRIPFPRPDEPLLQARQQAVARRGGNGFMEIAASHAALLLAQGAGRLIRQPTDRGVVAILDSRLATARYGSFLTRSLPPFWPTTDRDHALGALRRLSA